MQYCVRVVEPNYDLDRLSFNAEYYLKVKLLCEVSRGSQSEGKLLSKRGWASSEFHVMGKVGVSLQNSSLASLRRSTPKQQCREAPQVCTAAKRSSLETSRPVELELYVKDSLRSSQLVILLLSIKENIPSLGL